MSYDCCPYVIGLSLQAVTVTSDAGSTVTLGGIVMNFVFYGVRAVEAVA